MRLNIEGANRVYNGLDGGTLNSFLFMTRHYTWLQSTVEARNH